MNIAVEPTTACNLRCPECPSGLRSFSRPIGNLNLPFYREIIDEIKQDCIFLTLYFQGEPLIHSGFYEMVKYASQNGLYTLTSTNGHFLTEENIKKLLQSGLNRLVISIDGLDQETYESYRKGGNLEQVLQGVRRLVYWRKQLKSNRLQIIFQFLVVGPNEHQISEVREIAKELGVDDVWFKTAQIYDYHHGHPLIPSLEKYSRYKKGSDGIYHLKYPLKNQCWKMWSGAVITWNGLVVPCCFDKDAQYQLGDMMSQPLYNIWKSDQYRQFRLAILKGRDQVDICTNCTEGCQIFA